MISIDKKLQELSIIPLEGVEFKGALRSEINQLTGLMGVPLPQDYSDFLGKYGESMFDNEVNCGNEKQPLYFGKFFSSDEVIDAYGNLAEFLPASFIPIGDDGGDNVFCLLNSGRECGMVIYWNQDIRIPRDLLRFTEIHGPDRLVQEKLVIKIAASFTEFISNMYIAKGK